MAPGLSPSEIREQLHRILSSGLFSGARRQSRFLQFVVERAIEGQSDDIKESLIGVEVYNREPSYDPKVDSIVRAEASRLRAKLREYYDTGGRTDPVRIELPKGSYNPVFRVEATTPVSEPHTSPAASASAAGKFRWRSAGAAAAVLGAVLLLGAIALFWWPAAGVRRARVIAVMPPVNVGPDRTNDSLSEVLTDGLTSALVDSSEWKVAGRAPAVDTTGRDQMLTWLQQNLHADFVLTGSYRVGENSMVRLSLQLVGVSDGRLLWTRSYYQKLTYLAESQKEFVRAIVAEITEKTRASSRRPAPHPANEQARRYYAQARELWSRYTPQDLEQSLPLFRKAIDADPGFAAAWAGIADADVQLLVVRRQPYDLRLTDARAAAAKAIALDDGNGEAHYALGQILLFTDWKFRAGLSEIERAIALDPIRVLPYVHYSEALTILGDFAGAERAIEAARARLPPTPEILFQQGSVYFLARKPEKLEALGRELMALNPNGAPGHWLVGLALEERGQVREAIDEFKRGLVQDPRDIRTLCALGHAYALAGNKAQAFETAARYVDLNATEITRETLSSCAALVYIGLGRTNEAIEWVERARNGHDGTFPFLLYDPRFDPLRKDPRFVALLDSLRPGL